MVTKGFSKFWKWPWFWALLLWPWCKVTPPHHLGYPYLLLVVGHTWSAFVLPQQKYVSVHIIVLPACFLKIEISLTYNTVLISAVQQSESVIHILSLYAFPLRFIIGYRIHFPVFYSRTLLFLHPIYRSLNLLISNSQSIPPPPTCPHSATTSLFFMSVSLFLFCK